MKKLSRILLSACLFLSLAGRVLGAELVGSIGGGSFAVICPSPVANGQLLYDNAGACGGVTGWTTNGTTALTGSGNGALSTPALSLTGTWITGGSGSTTTPQFRIEPTGATSTGWSTSGTGLGINAAAGFGGDLARFGVDNTQMFRFGNTGNLTATGNLIAAGAALGGATIGTNALAVTGTAAVSGLIAGASAITAGSNIYAGTEIRAGTTSAYFWNNSTTLTAPADGQIKLTNYAATNGVTLSFPTAVATPTVQFGAADAAVAVAQTTRVQSVVAGTAAANGANWTLIGSLPTGTGTSGDIIFQTGVKTGSGTTQGTATTALTIKGETQVVNVASVGSAATPSFAVGNSTIGLYSVSTTGLGFTVGGVKLDYGITNSSALTSASQMFIAGKILLYPLSGSGIYLTSDSSLIWGSATSNPGGTQVITLSRVSDGVLQLGTTTTNALGSLNLTNLTATGVITVPGVTTAALTSTGTFTSGAGAQVGTLTNAPAAGNPTSWIKIVDNGTTRYIPAW